MDNPTITAIVGFNGSGKTRYVEQLRRSMASDGVRYMAFCDSYGMATDRTYYLQLRWNQHDIDEETPTVGQALQRSFAMTGPDTAERRELKEQLVDMLGLRDLLDKYVILLSSGELRKLQLAKTLMASPHTLILDNPFVGLDKPTRGLLKEILYKLAVEKGIIVYLVVSRLGDIPDYVTNTIWLTPEEEFAAHSSQCTVHSSQFRVQSSQCNPSAPKAVPVVEMNNVSVSYGGRKILDNICWTVNEGERWALSGRNGSGKSTLLSLICADNPQSYACDIRLFGRQRGSGETIWEIKRRIGYVSPEMHRSYRHNLPAIQIVASGLKDTVGLYARPNEDEKERCREWLGRFGLKGKEEQPFLTLSSGEQRLALLARAFVKEPALLVLDEPMHGLDDRNQQMVKDIINTYFANRRNTLIMVTHYEEELPQCITHYKTLSPVGLNG